MLRLSKMYHLQRIGQYAQTGAQVYATARTFYHVAQGAVSIARAAAPILALL